MRKWVKIICTKLWGFLLSPEGPGYMYFISIIFSLVYPRDQKISRFLHRTLFVREIIVFCTSSLWKQTKEITKKILKRKTNKKNWEINDNKNIKRRNKYQKENKTRKGRRDRDQENKIKPTAKKTKLTRQSKQTKNYHVAFP